MNLKRVGKTDIFVTDIAFGASSIGNMGRIVSEAETEAVLNRAWSSGIRYYDTAPHYGRGLAEKRLGTFLKSKPRKDYVLSTKVGRLLSPGPQLDEADGFVRPLANSVQYDYTGDGIEASLEHSLDLLQTGFIDIVFVHDIGAYTHGADNTKHLSDLMTSGLDRLQRLKDKGRIGAIGVGVNETKVCLDILADAELDAILLAGRLTLLDRQAEDELVDLCLKRSTSLVLGGIFNSGILATGPVEGALFDYQPATEDVLQKVRDLKAQTDACNVPLATAALHYARQHPAAASVLIGTAKMSSLDRNLAAFNQEIPEACMKLFGRTERSIQTSL